MSMGAGAVPETAPSSADEDSRLMVAFREGDPQCFERLFQKYKQPVVSFACRFTGRRDVAEELAQDIFVKVYLSRESYEPTAKFTTWLFRLARNHCLNERRRPEHRYRTTELGGEDQASSASPEADAGAAALQRAVEAALQALPESQRTALVLCRLQAMSYEEIAATMETSVGAVKSLLNRAKETMTKRLEPFLA